MFQFQYWVKTSSCKNIMRQLTPCGAWLDRKTYLCEAGFGWDDNPRHIEGVYSTLCLRQSVI